MTDSATSHARDLYRRATVWDAHSGFMPEPTADLTNLGRWRDAGVTYLSVDVGFDLLPWDHSIRTLAAFRHWIQSHDDAYFLAARVDDIRRAKQEDRMAIAFDIEGMNALDGRLEMVELYYSLGVRQMLVAYNRNNACGGGCHDTDAGLTDFGRQVIREMNRVGMIVDVSHCSYKTSIDAMEWSEAPVVFSHSNPRSQCDHERNIVDHQIKACAEKGGVVGIVGMNLFLGTTDPDPEAMAEHIEYVLDLAGPDHVGLGLDYSFPVDAAGAEEIIRNNPQYWPPERGYGNTRIRCLAPARLIELTDVLLRRGHSDDVILGVLGENFLRLAGGVWKGAGTAPD